MRRGGAVRRRALPDGAPTASTARWPASRAAATARWSCRCCAPTSSARSPRHAGDALFEACYLPEFPASPARCATSSAARGRRSSSEPADAGNRSSCWRPTATPRATRPTRRSPAARCCPSTSPGACSTTCGRSGWRRTRCGWRRPTPTRCARCAASTSTPAAATSTTWTSARRPSAPSWTSSASTHTLELFDGTHARLRLPLPGRDPGARARYRAVSGTAPSRAQASTAGHGP